MLSKNEIKNLRALHQKKFRDQERKILVEGERIIQDLVDRNAEKVKRIFLAKNFNANSLDLSDFDTTILDNDTIQQLAASKSPQGIVALIDCPEEEYEDDQFILVLDGIQDPGNFGTILRTAAWFGIRQIVCSPDSVDFSNPKVIQASMGSVYDVRISYQDLPVFLRQQSKKIYGALLSGKSSFDAKFEFPAVLVMGNEGKGISQQVLPFIAHPIHIPKFGVGESLNVASATSILLSSMALAMRRFD